MKKQLLITVGAVLAVLAMGMVPLGAAPPNRQYDYPGTSYSADEIAFTLHTNPATTRWKVQFNFYVDVYYPDPDCDCGTREYGFIDAKPWTAGTKVRFKTDPAAYTNIPRQAYDPIPPVDHNAVAFWQWIVVFEQDGITYQRSIFDLGNVNAHDNASFSAEYPTAVADTFTVTGPAQLDVLANDWYRELRDTVPHVPSTFGFDPGVVTFSEYPSGVRNPRHGTVVTDGHTMLYTPDPGYVGTDTFDYMLPAQGDSWSAPSWGRVTVKVEAAPPPPPPNKVVSFVGATTSTAKDTAFVNRLEAAGYTVTRFDDDTVTPAQVDGTIVVIASSVVPDTVRSFAQGLDERVVTWEPYIATQLGLARGQANGIEVEAASSTPPNRFAFQQHPITDGVDPVIVSGAGRWSTIHHPHPDYEPAPVTLQTIGQLISPVSKNAGSVAYITLPNKRVMLPWTYQNQSTLTPSGWKLFDQAVAWTAS